MSSENKINIVYAEDQVLARKSIISVLQEQVNFNIVGEASNGQELIEILKVKEVDIALIDIEMPIMNGHEATKIISSRFPKVKPIVISMHSTDYFISKLLLDGACAYLTKDCDPDEMIRAINKVHSEGFFISGRISKKIVASSTKDKRFEMIIAQLALTEREIEVLKLVCDGKSNKQISESLSISIDTVDFHRRNIYKKTNSENIAMLIKYAIRNGITSLD